MKIIIHKKEVLFDVMNKSHEEVAGIPDAEARYRIEAGEHKMNELERALAEVGSKLARRVHRYLVEYYEQEACNAPSLPEAFVYEFDFSERRMAGKAQPLADAMHSFLVHYTLAKFYASVSQTELSNNHSKSTQEAMSDIDELINTKAAPVI